MSQSKNQILQEKSNADQNRLHFQYGIKIQDLEDKIDELTKEKTKKKLLLKKQQENQKCYIT